MRLNGKNILVIIIVLGVLLIVDKGIFNGALPWWIYVLIGAPCGWFFLFFKSAASK